MEKTLYGLTEEEVLQSRKKNGSNSLSAKKPKSFLRLFLEGFRDPIIEILVISLLINAAFSFGSFRWYETAGILAAVVISTLVSTLSEKGSSKAFERMQKESGAAKVTVIRCGREISVSSDEIVVGDLAVVIAGTKIPADGKMIAGKVFLDQSALNGESDEAEKYPCEKEKLTLLSKSAAFRGSVCVSGWGVMEVTSVGKDTQYGAIAAGLSEEDAKSPLKERLSALARQISRIGYCSAGAVGIISFFGSFFITAGWEKEKIASLFSDPGYVMHSLLSALTLAITVVVVAVPEGLPMMISVVLSSNMKRMQKENVLVKKPVGIETAGSMNILFCDKTGTITTGSHKAEDIFLGNGTEITAGFSESALYKDFSEAVRFTSEKSKNGTDKALLALCRKTLPTDKNRVPKRFSTAQKNTLPFRFPTERDT